MDRQNEVCADKSKYTQRLKRLTGSMKDANGIKLNFKVYQTASKSSTWAGLSDSYLGDITSAALSAKHSRWHETQADDYGYEFLKKSGKNPWAMGLAFKKLKAISQQKDHSKYEKLLEAFSSHPDFDEYAGFRRVLLQLYMTQRDRLDSRSTWMNYNYQSCE